MFSKENYKSTRNLEAKKIILHEEFNGFDREIEFCLTTSASPPCITWGIIDRHCQRANQA